MSFPTGGPQKRGKSDKKTLTTLLKGPETVLHDDLHLFFKNRFADEIVARQRTMRISDHLNEPCFLVLFLFNFPLCILTGLIHYFEAFMAFQKRGLGAWFCWLITSTCCYFPQLTDVQRCFPIRTPRCNADFILLFADELKNVLGCIRRQLCRRPFCVTHLFGINTVGMDRALSCYGWCPLYQHSRTVHLFIRFVHNWKTC